MVAFNKGSFQREICDGTCALLLTIGSAQCAPEPAIGLCLCYSVKIRDVYYDTARRKMCHPVNVSILASQRRVSPPVRNDPTENTRIRTKLPANVAGGPNKSKPDQQDGGDKHHPNLEVNIPH